MHDKIEQYVKTWEARGYPDGIPDAAPYELEVNGLAPSYRRICMAILKNDYPLKTLGFTPKASPFYSALKKIEIEKRIKE